MQINRLDHLVLTVTDIDLTCNFYRDVLGMKPVTFNGRRALTFGHQKINLHQKGKEFDPKANLSTPGSADLCFIADMLITEVLTELKTKNIPLVEGPVERIGATGKIISVYFRDPDLNLIEVSNYL